MSVVYVVSDATGETGERVLRSALAQFASHECQIVRVGGVRDVEGVRRVVAEARERSALVLHTLVSDRVRGAMLAECRRQSVDAMDLMGPVLDRLTLVLDQEPQEVPGLFEQLREARMRAIEAVEFAFRHDDGQRVTELDRAEIVLVGVSRTMKTPISLYLAHRGWFVANVPIVPGLPTPPEIESTDPAHVFALTMRPARLVELRRARARHLHMTQGEYVELPAIRKEVREATEFFRRHRWHQVDVTAKSVEEASREILDLLGSGEREGLGA